MKNLRFTPVLGWDSKVCPLGAKALHCPNITWGLSQSFPSRLELTALGTNISIPLMNRGSLEALSVIPHTG